MRIVSRGRVFKPSGDTPWMATHAQTPLIDRIDGESARVLFATRDRNNRTRTAALDMSLDTPTGGVTVDSQIMLDLGRPGEFDDCGAMPSWVVHRDETRWLYFTGWNVSTTVPYRNAIGIAESVDESFSKRLAGPILDRTPTEPYFCATPCVLEHQGHWWMWYLSCTKWEEYKGHMEPFYDIKGAWSDDGVTWQRDGRPQIALGGPDEAGLARPSVLIDGERFRMWYSYRGYKDHRTDAAASYKIGYAESRDGAQWTRHDDALTFESSGEGWDDMMQAYPYVFRHRDRLLMLYNGNGFGAEGFGLAEILD